MILLACGRALAAGRAPDDCSAEVALAVNKALQVVAWRHALAWTHVLAMHLTEVAGMLHADPHHSQAVFGLFYQAPWLVATRCFGEHLYFLLSGFTKRMNPGNAFKSPSRTQRFFSICELGTAARQCSGATHKMLTAAQVLMQRSNEKTHDQDQGFGGGFGWLAIGNCERSPAKLAALCNRKLWCLLPTNNDCCYAMSHQNPGGQVV